MGPPNQGLEADDPPRGEIVDRLIMREEVVVVDGRPQLSLLLNAGQHGSVHLLAVHLEAVLAALLRLVHGDVRVAQELLARDARLVEGDADTAGRG